MYSIGDVVKGVGDLGREVYRGFSRNKFIYALMGCLTTSPVVAGCGTPTEPEVLNTEAEMITELRKVLENRITDEEVRLILPINVPPTEYSEWTIDAAVDGPDFRRIRYVELVSVDENRGQLTPEQRAAMQAAAELGGPQIDTLSAGMTEGEFRQALTAKGITP